MHRDIAGLPRTPPPRPPPKKVKKSLPTSRVQLCAGPGKGSLRGTHAFQQRLPAQCRIAVFVNEDVRTRKLGTARVNLHKPCRFIVVHVRAASASPFCPCQRTALTCPDAKTSTRLVPPCITLCNCRAWRPPGLPTRVQGCFDSSQLLQFRRRFDVAGSAAVMMRFVQIDADKV
ncbi:hypothetical protein TOPH_01173 [Tolypocladium ophioglossoides CBS 100239]|uniref:Uncharacterized protein n=1 Tax=Tolypocladium ophioglossoides (strain CBS 100239) TaxID=1163406 RepID=A0A0L0NJB1_TOLOC|nr:hypothetical protein TOPH_01173 [Tolypocladium ophioglossoides CBS 100239]